MDKNKKPFIILGVSVILFILFISTLYYLSSKSINTNTDDTEEEEKEQNSIVTDDEQETSSDEQETSSDEQETNDNTNEENQISSKETSFERIIKMMDMTSSSSSSSSSIASQEQESESKSESIIVDQNENENVNENENESESESENENENESESEISIMRISKEEFEILKNKNEQEYLEKIKENIRQIINSKENFSQDLSIPIIELYDSTKVGPFSYQKTLISNLNTIFKEIQDIINLEKKTKSDNEDNVDNVVLNQIYNNVEKSMNNINFENTFDNTFDNILNEITSYLTLPFLIYDENLLTDKDDLLNDKKYRFVTMLDFKLKSLHDLFFNKSNLKDSEKIGETLNILKNEELPEGEEKYDEITYSYVPRLIIVLSNILEKIQEDNTNIIIKGKIDQMIDIIDIISNKEEKPKETESEPYTNLTSEYNEYIANNNNDDDKHNYFNENILLKSENKLKEIYEELKKFSKEL